MGKKTQNQAKHYSFFPNMQHSRHFQLIIIVLYVIMTNNLLAVISVTDPSLCNVNGLLNLTYFTPSLLHHPTQTVRTNITQRNKLITSINVSYSLMQQENMLPVYDRIQYKDEYLMSVLVVFDTNDDEFFNNINEEGFLISFPIGVKGTTSPILTECSVFPSFLSDVTVKMPLKDINNITLVVSVLYSTAITQNDLIQVTFYPNDEAFDSEDCRFELMSNTEYETSRDRVWSRDSLQSAGLSGLSQKYPVKNFIQFPHSVGAMCDNNNWFLGKIEISTEEKKLYRFLVAVDQTSTSSIVNNVLLVAFSSHCFPVVESSFCSYLKRADYQSIEKYAAYSIFVSNKTNHLWIIVSIPRDVSVNTVTLHIDPYQRPQWGVFCPTAVDKTHIGTDVGTVYVTYCISDSIVFSCIILSTAFGICVSYFGGHGNVAVISLVLQPVVLLGAFNASHMFVTPLCDTCTKTRDEDIFNGFGSYFDNVVAMDYVGFTLLSFAIAYVVHWMLTWLLARVTVFDLTKQKPVKIPRSKLLQRCHNIRCIVISWRWDVNRASISESASLARCFKWARDHSYTHVMVDVVTLNQNAVDAESVLFLTKSYQYFDVLVAVQDFASRDEYQSRFWCCFEMCQYSNNPNVFCLDGSSKPTMLSNKILTSNSSNKLIDELITSSIVSATYQIDRVRVFCLRVPAGKLLLQVVLQQIFKLQREHRDVSISIVNEAVIKLQSADILLRGDFFRRMNALSILMQFCLSWPYILILCLAPLYPFQQFMKKQVPQFVVLLQVGILLIDIALIIVIVSTTEYYVLFIAVPPGHGVTSIVVRMFASIWIGRNTTSTLLSLDKSTEKLSASATAVVVPVS
jgi:hypothetical protein